MWSGRWDARRLLLLLLMESAAAMAMERMKLGRRIGRLIDRRPKVLVVGLVGGIASGKSTVGGMLQDLGAAVIYADQVGHEVEES